MRIIFLAFVASFVVGCPTPTFEYHRVSTYDQAGGVHIAVNSVIDWDTYKAQLQPKFTIDEKTALDEIIPTTMLLERQVRDLLALRLKVATPQLKVTSTETTTDQEVDRWMGRSVGLKVDSWGKLWNKEKLEREVGDST